MFTGKLRYIIIFIVFSVVLIKNGISQEHNNLMMLPGVSQQSYLNPAIRNKTDKLVIGVPFLSGFHFSWNTSFAPEALFSTGLWNYSFHDFYNNLEPTGSGQASAAASMFYASMNYDDYTFQVSLSERFFGTTTFNREIIKLIRDGVEPYWENDEDFGKGSFHYRHYRELAVGASMSFWEELDIGIRPKLLFGKMYFDARDVNFSVETSEEKYAVLVKPEGDFTMTGPVEFTRDTTFDFTYFTANVLPRDYSFDLRNMGFALDGGIVWRPDRYLELSVSILDLGFTGYKHNTVNVEFTEPAIYRRGYLYQSYNPEEINYRESREALKAFTDSVSYITDVNKIRKRATDLLPFKVNTTVEYNFTNTLSAGATNHFSYYGRNSVDILSAFINKSHRRFQAGASISMFNFSEVLAGLGLSYTGKTGQIFISSNNISGIIDPTGSKRLNLSFGINFLFDTALK